MLYKPNFCCNCGEKIERIEWNLLTSRRFCAVCSAEHRRHDYLPRAAVTAGALAVMFGFGSLWAGTSRDEARIPAAPVSIRSAMPAAPPVTERSEAIVSAPEQEAPDQATAKQGLPAISDRNVAAHYCGALTKKGTPCSRKVNVKGARCFQHEGRPAAAQ